MKRFPPARTSLALVALTSLGCVLVTKEGGELVDDDSTSASPEGTTTGDEADGDEHNYEESGAVGCIENADCGNPLLVCQDGQCVPGDNPLACNPATPPVCGNGIVEAMEECEGGPDCEPNCVGWWDGGGGFQAHGYIDASPRPGGEHDLLARDLQTGSILVGPAHNAGDFTASTVLDPWLSDPRALSTDPAGNVYVAGARPGESGPIATVVALDGSGNLRWTIDEPLLEVAADIAADANMVVIGAGVESFDPPAGTLWILDPQGNEVAHVSPIDSHLVSDVLIVDGEIFSLVQVPDASTEIARWDEVGLGEWTVPAAVPNAPIAHLDAIAPDGAGGVWAGGDTEGGPLLLRLDASGSELERIGCFGGRRGTIETLAPSPGGRLGMGLSVLADAGFEAPWFAVLTNGTIDFARQPGTSPDQTPNILEGHPIFVTWWSDGSFVVTHQTEAEAPRANWEIFFTP